ncbi:MAG: hypothetical protein PHU62_09275 [Bacteroidales bacterium]|jgi:hypothetical protein|nr:hypothetical protein [Bacteroidales bacterium]MDD2205428.1 hypothetical protein [Bacteroidales bacterium]MDD3152130.1 hypothetical protein [Bacteroidales bacterium]MDD3914814.1 hypothetical protein [Bacteroidales bacterium]MDD4634740.1 hypothetical protein [Bacteroidales bacterium]
MKQCHLNQEELEIYSLLYAANTDMKITKEELELITAEVEPDTFDRVKRVFSQDNDAERLDKIVYFRENYLKTKEQQDAFMNSMKNIFAADKQYMLMEKVVYSMLKKILDIKNAAE